MSRRPSYRPINANAEGVVYSPIGNNANAYPQVLDPEHGPQTVHRSDLFFANSNPHMNRGRTQPSLSDLLTMHHPLPYLINYIHITSKPFTTTHLRLLLLPASPTITAQAYCIPPINTTTNYDQYAGRPPASLPPPSLPPLPLEEEEEETVLSPSDDSNELAMALALSQSESIEHQKLQEQLRNQEEEDLARALAESMLSTGSNVTPAEDTPQITTPPAPISVDLPAETASISGHTPDPPAFDKPFPEFGLHEKWRLPGVSDKVVDDSHPSNGGSEQLGRKPSTNFSTTSTLEVPQAAARTRSLSISSISSLAYMQPDPELESTDSRTKLAHKIVMKSKMAELLPSSSVQQIPTHFECHHTHASRLSLIIPQDLEEPNVLVFDDEAYARQLAVEEEALAAQEALYPNEKARPMPMYDRDSEQALPLYTPQNQHYNGGEGPSSSNHSYFDHQPLYPSNLGNYNGISSTPISVYAQQSHAPQHPEHHQPFYGRKPSDAKISSQPPLYPIQPNLPPHIHLWYIPLLETVAIR
ncbi:hypothetical protein BJ912DRAFT_1142068, partial [Pholiota molesta]